MAVGNHPSENSKNDKIAETENICLGINITFQLQKLASLQLQDPVRHAASQKELQQLEQIFLCCSEVFLPNQHLQGEPGAGQSTDLLQLGGRKKVPNTLGN